LRGVALRLPALDLRLGRGVLLGEPQLALVLGGRLRERRLLLRDRGLGELHVGFIRLRLDHEQQVTLFDDGAVLEVHGLEIAGDPRDQTDGVAGLGVAGQLDRVGDGLLHGPADRHAGRRRRNVGVILAAAREQEGEQRLAGKTGNTALRQRPR
jgi:serine/threonine protein kinase HipA of HipAB toxin-antitoxin module